MKITILLAVRNEELYLEQCLRHLDRQGVEVCLIDNDSTDRTMEIAEKYRGKLITRVERFPYPGYYDWQGILRFKEQLAIEIESDWFMHGDADEFREAPEPYVSLLEAVKDVDAQGYNAINFDEFVFIPTLEDEGFTGQNFFDKMLYYYFFEPYPLRRVNLWKKNRSIDLASSGGHDAKFVGKKLFPENFIMRHYIILSEEHAIQKYEQRVFSKYEVNELGWHGTRATFTKAKLTLPCREQMQSFTERNWDRSAPVRVHGFMGSTRPPVPFVVGVGRSGTTLLRLMLDAHSQLAIPPETHFLPALFDAEERLRCANDSGEAFLDVLRSSHAWPDLHLDDNQLKSAINKLSVFTVSDAIRLLYLNYMAAQGKSRWGDKTPPYLLNMERIASQLPETHFVHIIRDGRDVALSYKKLWFGPGQDSKAQAKHWVKQIRSARKQCKSLPFYMEVRYEDLIRNPEKVLRKICDFISLDYEPGMLEYHKMSRKRLRELGHRRDENGNITVKNRLRRGIHKLTRKEPDYSRVFRWKKEMSKQDLASFESIAGSLLEELGYDL